MNEYKADFATLMGERFRIIEKQLSDNSLQPIHQLRKKAFKGFQSTGFPTKKHEEWKYTNLKDILHTNYDFACEYELSNRQLNNYRFGHMDTFLLVFLNGKFMSDFSSISPEFSTLSPEKGVSIMNMTDAYKAHQNTIDKHLNQYVENAANPFVLLNTAFMQDGTFVSIKKGKEFAKPVMILNFSAGKTLSQPRNLVVVEENAEVTIIEHFIALDKENAFTNTVTEILMQKQARVNHYKLQTICHNNYHIGTTNVHQQENSIFNSIVISGSGKIIRNNLNISLNGEYCQAYMNGFYMLKADSHVDNHTTVDHLKPNTYSNELYKGILDEQSAGVFNGKIFVRQNAQKTNAFQSNKNILLSKDASIDTKPQLKIWADDVKCSHGCTVGALDEQPMFYLRSRGIPEKKARALLMYAFATDVFEAIKLSAVRQSIEEEMDRRLK